MGILDKFKKSDADVKVGIMRAEEYAKEDMKNVTSKEELEDVKQEANKVPMKNSIEMAESRFNALKTMLNQLRTARKNLMIVKLDEDVEEEILEDIMAVTRKLKDIALQVVVIPGRKRNKVDSNDPRTELEISEEEAMEKLTERDDNV